MIPDTDDPVTGLRNLGPAFAESCARAGILTATQLRDLGTDAAYERILQSGARPHFIGYYVLEMALQGRPWNDCKGAEKTALRTRFDAIKARVAAAGPNETGALARLDRALEEIGVIDPARHKARKQTSV